MKLMEWIGSLMFMVALIDFASNPRKALESIPDVLARSPRIENGRMVIRTNTRKVHKSATDRR
jgi:hypothetical protein